MKRTIEVDYDDFMNAFVMELKDQYEQCLEEMEKLEGQTLAPYQREDLKNSTETADALLVVLRYNMTHRDYHDYLLDVINKNEDKPNLTYNYDINMASQERY